MHPLPLISSSLSTSSGIAGDSDIFLHSMYSSICAESSCESGSNSVDEKAHVYGSMSPSAASAALLQQQAQDGAPSGSAALLSTSNAVTIEASALDELLQEKSMKQERLARKAQLARINRKRKKQRMSELQDEVDALKQELELERKRHRSGRPPEPTSSAAASPSAPASPVSASVSVSGEQQQHILRSAVEELVMCTRHLSSSSAAVSPQAMQEVADAAKQVLHVMQNVEQSKLDGVRSLEQMLRAPSDIGFLQWLMSRSDMAFYTDPDGMWQSLFRDHIGLTPQQLDALEALRADVTEQRRVSTDIKNSVYDLEQKLIPHLQQQQRSLDSIASILDSEQLARFFVWVNDNQLCVKLLQNVS